MGKGDVITMDAGSLRMTVIRLKGQKQKIKEASNKALSAAGQILYDEIYAIASYRDHSLTQLAALDHPYAKRHGRIQIHTRNSNIVHIQGKRKRSKHLAKNIQHKLYKGKREYHVWINERRVPYAKYIVEGTKVMLQRNFLWDTMNARKTKKKMMKAVVRVMGKEMRTKVAVRFD